MSNKVVEIPLIIGGKYIKTKHQGKCVMPHDHQHVLGNFHMAGDKEVQQAIKNSMTAWNKWSKTSIVERTKIFRKAAELLYSHMNLSEEVFNTSSRTLALADRITLFRKSKKTIYRINSIRLMKIKR